MAVSVFPGVRLLSIGDANGDIQRHSEQQPLRLEVKTTQDTALLNLSNGEDASVFKCSVSRETECSRVGKQSFIITLGCNSVLIQFSSPAVWRHGQVGADNLTALILGGSAVKARYRSHIKQVLQLITGQEKPEADESKRTFNNSS